MRHHLSAFLVTLVLCLGLRECYPFSHFPMYSGISRTQHYFFLERAGGEPVMTRAYLGISASSMKKMYYSHLHELRDALKKDRGELGSEDYAAAGDSLLDQLFSGHRDRKAWREAPFDGRSATYSGRYRAGKRQEFQDVGVLSPVWNCRHEKKLAERFSEGWVSTFSVLSNREVLSAPADSDDPFYSARDRRRSDAPIPAWSREVFF